MSNVTLKHTPLRRQAPLTAVCTFQYLRCVLAAEHHTAEQFSKTGRQNPESIYQEASVDFPFWDQTYIFDIFALRMAH